VSSTGDTRIRVTWREAPPAVKALLAGVFVNKLGAFLQVFLVLFLTARGFSSIEAGLALGTYGAGAVVGVLVGGALTDRLGPRRATLLSMGGTALFVIAVLYVHNYPALLGTVALVAAVGQVYRPASADLLSALTPKERQVMIFAIYRLALNLGTTAAPLIGAALLSVSYNLLFWGEAIAALGFAVIALVALPDRGVGAQEEEDEPAGRPSGDGVRSGYLAVVADRRFTLFLVAMMVNAMVYIQYLAALPLAMKSHGLSTAWYSAMIALNGLIVITCELAVTRVVQRWAARRVVALGFTLLGGGLAVYALPAGAGVFIVGTMLWSLAEIVAGPTIFAYPAQAGPDPLRGRYIGAAQAMFGLGSAIGPVIGVAVWKWIGGSVWIACGVACGVGLAAAWHGMRPVASPDEEPVDATPPSERLAVRSSAALPSLAKSEGAPS
jgi:MFS family permease